MAIELYRNPIQRDGDFADPFVLRHDGRYFLYCTNPDLRCWSSDDLVDWRAEGPTVAEDEFPGLVPFAPEVVYAEGAFYMYTSPSGHGHFVLRAESPTGPFRTVTGNVGHAIDGNVLIDDDGRWYFYWAGDEGIWGCEMPSPTEFGEPVLTGVHMNGWTEGPFVSKRDGVYFMTLTGNHYLSAGYRIDAASSDHPLRGWQSDPRNPILVETEGAIVGLGHSSSVRGPDLVSTYLVYHNLNPDRSRDLDLDRQIWSGRSIGVLGPTTSAPAPRPPDAVSHGECRLPVGDVFTAEVNLTASTDAPALVIGTPGSPMLVVAVDRVAAAVRAWRGDAELGSAPLPVSFAHDALHCWRLEADGRQVRVFLDERLQFSFPFTAPLGSLLEVRGDGVRIGHCAVTATTPAAADAAAVVPVPGEIQMVLPDDSPVTRGIQVQAPGDVTLYLVGNLSPGAEITVAADDAPPVELQPRGGRVWSAGLASLETSGTLTLRAGGGPTPVHLTLAPASSGDAVRVAEATAAGWGKTILDRRAWDDVTVSATAVFTPGASGGHADVLLRATQLSEGGEGDDTRLGIHFLRGYSVQLHADRIVLARHAYDEHVLAEHVGPIDPAVTHSLEIRATGGRFTVDLDGATVIDVTDPVPHHAGRIGVRTADAELHLERLHIDPIDRVRH